MFFAPKIFFGTGPQIFGPAFEIKHASDHVAKFRGDRSTDLGDIALKNKFRNSSKTWGLPGTTVPGGLIIILKLDIGIQWCVGAFIQVR